MRYCTYVDEKKRNKKGMLPVKILFREKNKKFLVATGLEVVTKFTGVAVSSKEKYARMKTARLLKILDDVEKCVIAMPDGTDWDTKKAALREVITGKEAKKEKLTLADYIVKYAETKSNEGTRGLYLLTERKLREFDPKATFDSVDNNWLNGWRKTNSKMSDNGFSIHLRNLRTVFNWAIDNEITDRYPFRRFKIKTERTAINNISLQELRTLRDYPVEPWQEIYRDFFMLSFYLCGINTVDLLSLKKSDYRNGRIRYRRRKTGRLYDIPVPDEADEIIKKYRGKDWLLSPLDVYKNYKDFSHHWNDALRKIGPSQKVKDKCGKLRKVEYSPILPSITVYSARYTFASLGAEIDIPRETIALCLGHAWSDVTSRYINYDNRKIDEAVKKIVTYVNAE